MYEPEIKGNQIIFRNDTKGYNGKLTVDTLLPKADNTVIETVGGEGKEFWVAGQNFPAKNTYRDNLSTDGVGYRIELSPKQPSETDYFLNVLQVADSKPDMPPLPVTDISTDKIAGAQIADRVVVFNKKKGRTKDAVEFSVTGDKTYKVMVADVLKGTWRIEKDGVSIGNAVATKEGGLLNFEGTYGDYKLTFVNDKTDDRVKIEPYVVEQEYVGIRIDRKFLYTDTPPVIRSGRTLVPMRAIFEALDADIIWDDASRTVTGTRGNTTVKLTIDSDVAYVNDKEITLDVAPTLISSRTMVPIRFVSESLNAKVDWDPFALCVYITSPTKRSQTTSGAEFPPKVNIPNALSVYAVIQSGSDGNDIENTLDGSFDTRWSMEGTEKSAWAVYDLGEVKELAAVWLAFFNGDKRVSFFSIEVSQDDQSYERILDKKSTSGSSLELERYALNGVKARYVKVLGGGNTVNMWNSITQIAFEEKK